MKFEICYPGAVVFFKNNEVTRDKYANFLMKKLFITKIHPDSETVDVATIDVIIGERNPEYKFVDPELLTELYNQTEISEYIDSFTNQPTEQPTEQAIDFKIISSSSQLSVYYKGKKIAVVDHNNYDEEFELNLLLRRACQKLNDKHTVVKTVEELLQKS